MTTAKELAERLDGRKYPLWMSREEVEEAQKSGLVVLCGASDDLCEIYCAITDEAGCWNGGDLYLMETGFCELDEDEEPPAKARKISAWWCAEQPDGTVPSWSYTTDMPHETFRIMEDNEIYCIGLVFRAEDIAEKCECCDGNEENLETEDEYNELIAYVRDEQLCVEVLNDDYMERFTINFCPMCGRKLKEG